MINNPISFDSILAESFIALYEAYMKTIQYKNKPTIPEYNSVLRAPTSEAYLFFPICLF